MRHRLGVILILICSLAIGGIQWRAQGRSSWLRVAPGLEMRTLWVNGSGDGAGGVRVIALRAAASRVHVAAGTTLEAAEWRSRDRALAATNGGYFDHAGASLGLRVCSGSTRGSLRRASGGVFYIAGHRPGILAVREFAKAFPSRHGVWDAVQCSPLLVKEGQPGHLKPQWARRTGIGIQRDAHVVVAVADGEMTLPAWAALWASRDGMDCRDALNLDGGPSAQLSLQTAGHSVEVQGGWPVPDAIIIR